MFPASALSLFVLSTLASSAFGGRVFTDPSQLTNTEYDFIVVGAGTAGNVIAARLAEARNQRVLVIEAGRSNVGYDDHLITIPFLGPVASPGTSFDWNYTTVAQTGISNQLIPYPRGYVLGGSSSTNYMVYTRGAADDYDRFASLVGDSSYSWRRILPYAYKNEKHVPPNDGHDETGQFIPSLHGFHGPLLTSLPGFATEIDDRVIATTRELRQEFPWNTDYNGGNPLGVSWMHSTVGGALRSSSATAYLWPAVNSRPNIDLLYNSQVTRLIRTGTDRGRPAFRGVEFARNSTARRFTARARKEVILSAGSIGTPQILLLSGIGDPAELRSVGITPVVNLPDVGRNLADHPLVPIQWTVNSNNTMDPLLRGGAALEAGMEEYRTTAQGRMAANGVSNHMSFFRLPRNSPILRAHSDPSSGGNAPHYELAFGNGFFTTSQPIPTSGSYFTIINVVVSPAARGSIVLASSDPFAHPIIDPKLLSTDYDIQTMVHSFKAAQRFAAARAWNGYITGPYRDAVNATSDANIIRYIRQWATTIKHPFCTAMASKDPRRGVLDSTLSVKNTAGLRVVDASAFPFIPAGHPQAMVYIIAERAADVIKAAYHL